MSGWKAFVDEQLKRGAGALHRFTKRPPVVACASIIREGCRTTAPQRLVEAECEASRKVWFKFEDTARAPWRGAQLHKCEPLPAITGECIAKVARTYKEKTGLGCDGFHPRLFGWLSADLLSALAVLLTAIEGIGFWPAQIQGILVPLIPKADGGRRPIGLLAAIVRVWERIRKPVVATWRKSVERPYNWAAKGRSPQAAAWHHSLRAEAAVAM